MNGTNNNQMSQTNQNALQASAYDASGDVLNDGVNTYLYDAEGRICAVASTPIPGMTVMTGYLYDAGGTRVAKGSITAWSCDPSANGFTTINDYVLGLGGEQVTEMGMGSATTGSTTSGLAWQHTNVWAGGKLLGTYDNDGLHFYLDDPLGTRRVQTDYAGVVEKDCASLPYGDGETCAPTPTEHLFTGKERDAESGNDYFEARYYSSAVGRFMSPDWSAQEEPVPYSKLDDPQTLNLYGYLRNNPLGGVDADGHCGGGANNPPCPSPSKEDKAAVKDAVDRSNKPTTDDKKGKNHEEAVMTGKDANGNHAIVPAKPGAYSDVTKPGGTATVNPSTAADPSKQSTINTPEVEAHVHPAGTATTDSTNSAGQTVETTHYWIQTPSQADRDAALPAPGITFVVGAGSTGNASGSPTVYFYNSSGTTCTESYKDFLK